LETRVAIYPSHESGAKNVAQYVSERLKQDRQFGTVAVGNRADTVPLEANPLQTIANLTSARALWCEAVVSAAEIDASGRARCAMRAVP
jgi:hypothetical protein